MLKEKQELVQQIKGNTKQNLRVPWDPTCAVLGTVAIVQPCDIRRQLVSCTELAVESIHPEGRDPMLPFSAHPRPGPD